jgi:ABC-type phosphate transport system ATPase subunit
MSETVQALYEQLIHLDEIAGELDPESNRKIDEQRASLVQQIKLLEQEI